MRHTRIGLVAATLVCLWLLFAPHESDVAPVVRAGEVVVAGDATPDGSRLGAEPRIDGESSASPRTALEDAAPEEQPASVVQPELGSLAGCLYDQHGLPMPKATLRLVPRATSPQLPASTLTSGRDGCFRSAAVVPGEWWICLKPNRSETFTRLGLAVVEAGEETLVTLMLSGDRSVSGRITMGEGWSVNLDHAIVELELSCKSGPDAGLVVATGHARTDAAHPELSGSFTMRGLRAGLYVLKATPFVEGDHLALEIDLHEGDAVLEPVVIGPGTALLPPR